jgi:hypothetical protein
VRQGHDVTLFACEDSSTQAKLVKCVPQGLRLAGISRWHSQPPDDARSSAALAGDLDEAHVRPTLEIVITESPTHLHRKEDPTTGLPLISP